MKRIKSLSAILIAALLLSGCGASSQMKAESITSPSYGMASDSISTAPAPTEPMETPSMEPSLPMAPEYSNTSAGESVYQRADAKLIRRCTIRLQTTEFDAAVGALNDLVDANGGYFENSSVYAGGYYDAYARRSGEYIVRVPAEKYNAFRSAVGNLGYVTVSNESTEDIGEQYYDTEARLATLRTKQERLLALLEKAENMEDIITLDSALGDVEYEIERYASTLNRYDGLVSFATFTIEISEVVRVEPQTGKAASLGERMLAGFRSGLEDLQDNAEDFMVWLSYHIISIVIFLVVLAAAVILIRKGKFRLPKLRRRGKKNSDSES